MSREKLLSPQELRYVAGNMQAIIVLHEGINAKLRDGTPAESAVATVVRLACLKQKDLSHVWSGLVSVCVCVPSCSRCTQAGALPAYLLYIANLTAALELVEDARNEPKFLAYITVRLAPFVAS